MKKFQFPLDRVREYRCLQMEGEQVKLEELHARLIALEEMAAELVRQKQQAEQSVVGSSSTGLDLQHYAGYRGYAVRVAAMVAERRQAVLRDIEAQRARLLEARQKYEILDRLKTRSRGAWQAAVDREQESLAGELYLARWGSA